ncbi:uncharacterized protein [Oryza sativa Japonica Group]|uniref:DUF4378 domain-containing protein n=4 Tax=Oryza sativa subsp. japonica TaxID=39947 RepID=Q10BF7_ORYSJ|nr:uncharacterized protein LOC4334589 [Oryza sativa Japonica Group]AAO65865.1 hypothetical protein [Oryza sativa Japonica Group]ABF99577.1 expressed protein [Oryza sativa Japonica Group]KAF2942040.1 hypothetical protein DAI22_03g392800 [Oryza sativa Japonica Group]
MGGQGAGGGGGRRWTQRPCRTGGGGVVRRTVAALAKEQGATAAAAVPRRAEGTGLSLVGKQRCIRGVSNFRSNTGSTTENDYICSDSRVFNYRNSSGTSTRCSAGEQLKNGMGSCHSQPSVLAELMHLDTAKAETSFSSSRRSKFSYNWKSLHGSSTTSSYGSPCHPMFNLSKHSTNPKPPPPLKNSARMSNFSYQLVRSAESPKNAKYSLSEKMSHLLKPPNSSSHQNGNFTVGALKRRHNIAHFGGAINKLLKNEVHKKATPSEGRHWQTLLDNSLIRQNKLYCSEPRNEESTEQSWSSTDSESEKAVCFSSSGSIADLHASVSTDTSDSSDHSMSSSCLSVNDRWKMTFKKVHCALAANLDSMYVTNHKELEQPSPVSVLEIPDEDFSVTKSIKLDLHPESELVRCPSVESTAEVGEIGISDYALGVDGLDASLNGEAIQLVEDIFEEFGDEEEREFSYVLDILIVSGIHGTAEDQLYKVCQSLDCPAGYDVFEKLEKKYMKVAEWSRSDRKLIFDMVNTILSEILAPCLDMHPWVKSARKMAPVWGSEGLLEKILQMLVQRREELGLSKTKPEKKALDRKWPDLSDCIDRVGRDVENMIKDDLLEEMLLDLFS